MAKVDERDEKIKQLQSAHQPEDKEDAIEFVDKFNAHFGVDSGGSPHLKNYSSLICSMCKHRANFYITQDEFERFQKLIYELRPTITDEWIWTDELIKEMIWSKLPLPDHYVANVQKCLDEFKASHK